MDFIVEHIAGAAGAGADRAAALDHEVRDDAVEAQTVVVRGGVGTAGVVLVFAFALGQFNEVGNRLRSVVAEEVKFDVALVGVQDDLLCSNTHSFSLS